MSPSIFKMKLNVRKCWELPVPAYTVYLIVSSVRYRYCAQCFVTASASDLHLIGSWLRFRIPNTLAKRIPGIIYITVIITTYIVFVFNRTKSDLTFRFHQSSCNLSIGSVNNLDIFGGIWILFFEPDLDPRLQN
jgi:hypothetical protein